MIITNTVINIREDREYSGHLNILYIFGANHNHIFIGSYQFIQFILATWYFILYTWSLRVVIQCCTGPWPHWRTPTTDALRSSPQSSVSSSILHLEDLASRLFDVALKFTLLPSNSFFSKKTRFPSVTNVVKNTTGTKNQVQESHHHTMSSSAHWQLPVASCCQ